MDFDLRDVDIRKIDGLCNILKREEGPDLEWFRKLNESVTSLDPYTAHSTLFEEKKGAAPPILTELFGLLKVCLLNMRWQDALGVLQKLVQIPSGTQTTVWKVGTELMALESDANRDQLQQLYNKMKVVVELHCKEVVMDFVVYLLSIGETTEALSTMQENIVKRGVRPELTDADLFFEYLQKAYRGLLWYLEWRKCKSFLQKCEAQLLSEKCQNRTDIEPRIRQLEMQCNNFSSKACQSFEAIIGRPGIWDIFVTKHVELLVDQGQISVAEDILNTYCSSNQDNLNAHKYLHHFLRHYSQDETRIREQLMKIAELSPSDSLVLQLVDKLWADKDSKAIQYVFLLLDYSVWQMKTRPWKTLCEMLTSMANHRSKHGNAELDMVRSCWSRRKSWWAEYHFTNYVIKQGEHVPSLNFYKLSVAAHLCGTDCQLVKDYLSHLTEEESRQILDMFSLFKDITT